MACRSLSAPNAARKPAIMLASEEKVSTGSRCVQTSIAPGYDSTNPGKSNRCCGDFSVQRPRGPFHWNCCNIRLWVRYWSSGGFLCSHSAKSGTPNSADRKIVMLGKREYVCLETCGCSNVKKKK